METQFDRNKCRVCHNNITIAIFRGTGICSDNCRKQDEKKEK